MSETSIASMSGKTVLVTGATNGIGKAAALDLARLGAEVILVGRDRSKAEAARAEIAAATKNDALAALTADLSSQAEVRRLADAVSARWPRLDVLVNNAGALHPTRKLSVDGIELTFATNHLAYFLLTHLLLESLKAAPSGRVVNVATDWHRKGVLDWENLQGEKRWDGTQAYATTKLENILFTYELARRLDGTKVTANCLHPGVVRTGFWHHQPGIVAFVFRLAGPLMLSPEKGAQPILHLASSPQVEGVTGKYFIRFKPARSLEVSYDAAIQKRLWELSAKLTGVQA